MGRSRYKVRSFYSVYKRPPETIQHVKALLTGHKQSELGHNPAGALVMIALMLLILLIGLTGYWGVKEFLGNFMSEAHEVIASVTLWIVIIHIAAAIIMSFLQKENLIKSMVTGKKQGAPEQAIRYPMYVFGAGLAVVWGYSFYLIISGALPSLTR